MVNFVTGANHLASHDPTVNEPEAIANTKLGDMSAFAWLMGRYKHMVYTVVHRVVRDPLDAEEATQDTFVKVFQKVSDFRGGSKFSTWLFSIAYRTAVSHVRKRHPTTTDIDEVENDPTCAAQKDWAHASDRTKALTTALAQLPREEASIIGLYYLEEMTVEEIVTITGLGASNVKVKLHRGRKRLYDLLQDQLKNEVWTLIQE